VLGLVSESCPNLVGIVTLNESAGRTYCSTLTAGDTGCRAKGKVKRLSDTSIDTAVVCADNSYVLLLTNRNAAAAKNTLVIISYKVRCRVVKLICGLEAIECT
jgi:hypothetical protein